jgi:hypothetical protein
MHNLSLSLKKKEEERGMKLCVAIINIIGYHKTIAKMISLF